MYIKEISKQTMTDLKSNRLRSILSVLGIVIGVAAVVLILSMGTGLKKMALNEVESFGPNVLDIAIKIPEAGEVGSVISMAQGVKITTLKPKDVKDLKNKDLFPYITAVSGQVFGQDWVKNGGNEERTMIYGCNADFLDVLKIFKLQKGRFFTETENRATAQTAVLGNGIAEKIFGSVDPIGKTMKVGNKNFTVIGVLEPYGGISFGGVDMNDFVYAPLETILNKVVGIDYLSEIVLTVKDKSYIKRAKKEMAVLLRKNHNIKDPTKDDFMITGMDEVISQVENISFILNLLLGFLATISLVVGGVGIMNVMLVSVSERTKEIGLRKALGATSKNIMTQFLMEGIIITGAGGLIGILFGIITSIGAGLIIKYQFLSSWPLSISWFSILIAVAVSTSIGLIFSIYPAKKASELDPIEALRKV